MSDIFQKTLQQFEFSALVPNYTAQALVYVIWDTFDSNRQLALQLVKTLNKTKLMVSTITCQSCDYYSCHVIFIIV